jgi:hypothetical protein
MLPVNMSPASHFEYVSLNNFTSKKLLAAYSLVIKSIILVISYEKLNGQFLDLIVMSY